MKLLELEPKFKTKELIESMIEVAEFQASRMANGRIATWDSAVHVNLGRRAGHTNALIEIGLKNKDELLIITPAEMLSREYRSLGIRSHSISGNFHGSLRGIHGPVLIFESVPVEKARDFYIEFGGPYLRPKAILLVGCY